MHTKRTVLSILVLFVSVYVISCTCGSSGSSKGPQHDIIPVSPDTSPPIINTIRAVDKNRVVVDFSESLSVESAESMENYIITTNSSAIMIQGS